MARGYIRTQTENIDRYRQEIVLLRDRMGWSWHQIGQHFKKHHATIMHNYRKAKTSGVVDDETVTIDLPEVPEDQRPPLPAPDKYRHLLERSICTGKTYDEYVASADRQTQSRARATKGERDFHRISRECFF